MSNLSGGVAGCVVYLFLPDPSSTCFWAAAGAALSAAFALWIKQMISSSLFWLSVQPPIGQGCAERIRPAVCQLCAYIWLLGLGPDARSCSDLRWPHVGLVPYSLTTACPALNGPTQHPASVLPHFNSRFTASRIRKFFGCARPA